MSFEDPFVQADPAVDVVLHGTAEHVELPPGLSPFQAEFSREGTDLVLTGRDGQTVRIIDYFDGTPANLTGSNGSEMSGALVARLAGPQAPGQMAQSNSNAAELPIGQVETLEGTVTAQRADGTVVQLSIGSKVFEDDIITTADGGAASLTFVDGTIFTLAAASRMILDELIYDPNSTDNSAAFNLVEGGFVFIAGQVAGTGGMDVSTPTATMGIRGTTVSVNIQTEDGVTTVQVALNVDPDGGIGSIELRDLDGNLLSTIERTDVSWIVSPREGETREIARVLPDDAPEALLINEAYEAFRIAVNRVEEGGTFVELDEIGQSDPRTGGTDDNPDQPDQSGFDTETEDLNQEEPLLPQLDPLDNESEPTPPQETDPEPEPETETDTETETEANADPTTGNLSISGAEDETISGRVTAADPDGDTVRFTLGGSPNEGSVVVQEDGTFDYTPNPDFNGTDRFTIVISDGRGGQTESEVTVTVSPTNDAPRISDSGLSTDEDNSISGRVTATDPDPGDTTTYTLATDALNGSVVLNPDGTFTYTPNTDFAGTDSFLVDAVDNNGASSRAKVEVTVNPIADDPSITGSTDISFGGSGAVPGGSISGVLTADDPDAGATATWEGSSTGTYGTFTIEADGSWTYTLFSSSPTTPSAPGNAPPGGAAAPGFAARILQNVRNLAEGETATEQFVVRVTDDTGATDSTTLSITLQGTNDAPVIFGSSSASLVETGTAGQTTSGQLNATDPDSGATATWSTASAAAYGSFTINAATGAWTYTLDETHNDIRALPLGSSLDEIIVFKVIDDKGATDTFSVTIKISGSNDKPVISGVSTGSLTDGGTAHTATGQLTATDADAGTTITWSSSGTGVFGKLSIDPNSGIWSYTLFDAGTLPTGGTQKLINSLGAGDTVTERFIVTANDGAPGGNPGTDQEVVITLVGTNDAPVISGTHVGAVTDTNTAGVTASGGLTATDPDQGSTATFSGNATGMYGSFSIEADSGQWIYRLDASDTDTRALAQGQTATERFVVTVTDDQGATDTQEVTITITGSNDAPVISGTASGSLTDNSTARSTSGQLTALDPDAGATATWSAAGTGIYGQLSIDTNSGVWTYTLNAVSSAIGTTPDAIASTFKDISSLTAGETATERFTITVTDDQGETDTHEVSITLTGTNDLPYILGTRTGAVTDTGASGVQAQGTLRVFDADDGSTASLSGGGAGTYGSLALNSTTGQWVYTLNENDPETRALTAGQTAIDSFTITVTDDQGATNTRAIEITITGSNDAPRITGTHDGAVTDTNTSGVNTSGQITVTDPDTGATVSFSGNATGTYGGFEIDAASGQWVYRLNHTDADTRALAAGETATERFTVTATDDQGATDTHQVEITITGSNDLPIITGNTSGSVNDINTPGVTAMGTLTAIDPDNSATASFSGDATGTYGSFEITADGSWSYTLNETDADTRGLKAFETASDRFTVTVTDDKGATSTQEVTVTVTGTNDAPTVTTVTHAAVQETDSPVILNLLNGQTDVDGDALSAIDISALDQNGNAVAFTNNNDGTVTIDPAQFAALNTGESANITVNYKVSDGRSSVTNTASLTVEGISPNVAPSAGDDVLEFRASKILVITTNNPNANDGPTAKAGLDALGRYDLVSQTQDNTSISASELAGYDAVLTFANSSFPQSAAYGDKLAAFIANGGGVVNATFAFNPPFFPSSTSQQHIGGAFENLSAFGFSTTRAQPTGNITPTVTDDTIWNGVDVSELPGSYTVTNIYHAPVLNPGATLLARYGTTGQLGIARNADGSVISANMFPGSSPASETDFWTLFANMLDSTVSRNKPEFNEDTVATIEASRLLANDTDGNGDTLTITAVATTSIKGATLTLVDGDIRYDPNSSAILNALNNGGKTTDTFTYTVSDGNGGTSTATVTLTVGGANETVASNSANGVMDLRNDYNDSVLINLDDVLDLPDTDNTELEAILATSSASSGLIPASGEDILTILGDDVGRGLQDTINLAGNVTALTGDITLSDGTVLNLYTYQNTTTGAFDAVLGIDEDIQVNLLGVSS